MATRVRACSRCGTPGHNVRTCPVSHIPNASPPDWLELMPTDVVAKLTGYALTYVYRLRKRGVPVRKILRTGQERMTGKRPRYGTPEGMYGRCSRCGGEDHDRRTCSQQKMYDAVIRPCAICGVPGHNVYSCPQQPDPSKLTVADVARYTGRHPRTIRRWRKKGMTLQEITQRHDAKLRRRAIEVARRNGHNYHHVDMLLRVGWTYRQIADIPDGQWGSLTRLVLKAKRNRYRPDRKRRRSPVVGDDSTS